MPTYHDPFGDYDHLRPVPLEQAAKELQIAQGKEDHLKTVIQFQNQEINKLQLRLDEARKEIAEKEFLLRLSAMNTFIPPNSEPTT